VAIDRSAFIGDIATRLEEYGEWETDTGSELDGNLLDAMLDWWEKRDWPIALGSDTLTVSVDGLQGPYTPPSDFDSMITPERVSRYFDYDRFAIPPAIPDDSNGIKYELTHDRLNNKLHFRHRPAAGTYTFYYRKSKPSATSALSDWPEEAKRYLKFRTMYYSLIGSEDLAKQAKLFEQEAENAYRALLAAKRRGESKQDVREPQDVYGYPLAQGYANDGEGFLGGE
jgi:hypothetical protein